MVARKHYQQSCRTFILFVFFQYQFGVLSGHCYPLDSTQHPGSVCEHLKALELGFQCWSLSTQSSQCWMMWVSKGSSGGAEDLCKQSVAGAVPDCIQLCCISYPSANILVLGARHSSFLKHWQFPQEVGFFATSTFVRHILLFLFLACSGSCPILCVSWSNQVWDTCLPAVLVYPRSVASSCFSVSTPH